tara:strand:+ start:287 stop:487 length:201 start_codon:yes stop_codon:yes gene_type:complete
LRDDEEAFVTRVGDVVRVYNGHGKRGLGTVVDVFKEHPQGPQVVVVMYPDGEEDELYQGHVEVLVA